MKMQLPDDAIEHDLGEAKAYTIPANGFQKLIAYANGDNTWVHQDYRLKTKTKKKKKKTK
jgi:hypothetical protein